MRRHGWTRPLALALALLLIGTMAAGAAKFTDLENHWAKDYMLDLYERGYLNGVTETQMKPDVSISGGQTLALLSRLLDVDDSALALAKADYQQVADKLIPTAQSWLNNENAIVLCLAGGIIGETELQNLIKAGGLTASLTREYLCVLFARAMGLEERAKSITTSTMRFNDLTKISSDCLPYVQVLYDAGIVEGNNKNEFAPKSGVTRAVVATMYSRTLEYLERNGGLPQLTDYTDTVRLSGVVTDASARNLRLTTETGTCYAMPISSAATITLERRTIGSMAGTYVGTYATVNYDRKTQAVTAIAIASDQQWVQGIVRTSDGQTITLTDPATDKSTSYIYDSNTTFTYAGKAIEKSSLARYYLVTASVDQNDKLLEVRAQPGSYTLHGALAGIDYDTTCELTLTDSRDVDFVLSFPIAKQPTFLRGGIVHPDGLSRLQEGEELEITVTNGKLDEIATDETASTVAGTVTAIAQNTRGYTITVEDEDGDSATYAVSSYATITKNNNTITMAALRIGDNVTLTVAGSDITAITVNGSGTGTATSTTGAVLYVDTSKRQIMLQQPNGLLYVNTRSATIVNSTGGTETLKSIEVGDTILVYGTAAASNEINATLITILK